MCLFNMSSLPLIVVEQRNEHDKLDIWIEKDLTKGLTSEDERVNNGDIIDDNVVVHLNCNNW